MATVRKTRASLRLQGEELDPDEVTRLLGKVPDTAERRGDVLRIPSGRERIARWGRWSVSVERRTPGDLDGQIAVLLDGTTNDLELWRRLTSSFDADVFCGLFLTEGNEGLCISPRTLLMLGERGIKLGLDIYALGRDNGD